MKDGMMNPMMQRRGALLLAAAVCLMALVGCGPKKTPSDKENKSASSQTAIDNQGSLNAGSKGAGKQSTGSKETGNKETGNKETGSKLYENNGLRLSVPLEYDGQLIVTPEKDGKDGLLFSVAEKASVDAAKKQGGVSEGVGALFAIGRITEAELNERRCSDMSGQEPFAKDADGNCYIFYHPTDVRLDRGSAEITEEDLAQWKILNEWAWGKVRESFIAENSGLKAFTCGNSDLEMFLARVAFRQDTRCTLSAPGAEETEPGSSVDMQAYARRLIDNLTVEVVDIGEKPEGECAVVSFPDDGYRFEFFISPGKESYVRQTWCNGENEMLYKAICADGTTNASAVVKEWCQAASAVSVKGGESAAPVHTPDELVGTWAEKVAHRGVITISRSAQEGKYDVRIVWSGSASEKGIWEMTAEPAGEGGAIRYENGKHLIRTYTAETEYNEKIQYENGRGAFCLNSDGEIVWTDETGKQGDDCVFVRAG